MAVKIKQRLEYINTSDLLSEVLRRLRDGERKNEKQVKKLAWRIVRRIEGRPENPAEEEKALQNYSINVNGEWFEWKYETIDWRAICWLADKDCDLRPDVFWRTANSEKSGRLNQPIIPGKIEAGGSIRLQQGMVFTCSAAHPA